MQAVNTSARRLLLAACAGAALTLGIAHAQTAQPASAPASATPRPAPRLSIREIYDRMEAAGYRDLRQIEFDTGRYEVKARNPQGERVKLDVNATTGEIEHERNDR